MRKHIIYNWKSVGDLDMDEISIKAYAKVNLGLDVVGKTENGYHLLRSVMQQIDLYDVLTLRRLRGQAGKIEFSTGSDEIPADGSNLAYRAAALLTEEFGLADGVCIELDKRIPVAAGMAGGSTDGAAVINGMNELFGLGLSLQERMDLGVRLGADIPFCIMGGTALAEGIGEKLTPLHVMPDMTLLITKPKLNVSTKYVYEHLHLGQVEHPDTDGILKALQEKDLAGMIACLGNVLESVAGKMHPIIGELEEKIKAAGADGAIMSGSGPTVFGIFGKEDAARKAEEEISALYPDIFVKAVAIRTNRNK